MASEIKVKIQKSPVPIVWLDTSIINNITKWKFGIGEPLEEIASKRVQKLYDLIYKFSRAGKLICPESEQPDEVWIAREMWMKIMDELSMGINTARSQTIHDNQIRRFMTAYLRKEQSIKLDYQEAFLSDPVSELKERLNSGFFVCVDSGIIGGHENLKNVKRNTHDGLEMIRENNVKKGVTFERQLEVEFTGEIQGLLSLEKDWFSNTCTSPTEELNAAFGYIALSKQIEWWERFGGFPKGIEGLNKFHKSPYYRAMPHSNLSCRLMAYIVTKKEPIKPGDSKDIDHISAIMPYADLFVTDRAMKNIIKQQTLDLLYNTKVCYIGDTDIIEDYFSKL